MASRVAKKLIHDLEANVYCRLRPSRVHGVGVFAIRDIPKGKDPFKSLLKYRFTAVDVASVLKDPKIDKEVKKLASGMYATAGGKIYLYRGGLNGIDISFFLNHSEKPNLAIRKNGESFVTMKKIKKGTELFSDHRTYSEHFFGSEAV